MIVLKSVEIRRLVDVFFISYIAYKDTRCLWLQFVKQRLLHIIFEALQNKK